MCDALMELMKEEMEKELEASKNVGLQQGIELIICNALQNGHTPEQISVFTSVSLEEVLAVQKSMEQKEQV